MTDSASTPPSAPSSDAPAPNASASPLSIVSFVLGISSMMGPGFFFGIPAIITGAIALKKKQDNRVLSITGIITGSVSTVVSLLLIGLIVWAIVWTINNPQVLETPAPAPTDQPLFESTET